MSGKLIKEVENDSEVDFRMIKDDSISENEYISKPVKSNILRNDIDEELLKNKNKCYLSE